MLRGLLNVAAAFALLSAVTLAAVWLLTRHTPASLEFVHNGTLFHLSSHAGRLCIDNTPQQRLDARLENWLHNRGARLLAESRALRDHAGPAEMRYLEAPWSIKVPTDRMRKLARDDEQLGMTAIRALELRDRVTVSPIPSVNRSLGIAPILATLALLTAPWMGFRVICSARLRARRKANRCPTCNYDVRATPTRCPECGTEFRANLSPPPP